MSFQTSLQSQPLQAQTPHSLKPNPTLYFQHNTIISTIKMRFSIAAITAAIMATAIALPTPDAEKPAGMFFIFMRLPL